MFTLDQIEFAHSKVKSGADFPAYVHELNSLGVASYEIFVDDGREVYYNDVNDQIISPPKYPIKIINSVVDLERFKSDLKRHQQGESNYFEFIDDCASCGIVKWEMDIRNRICTYFDLQNQKILSERVPA